VKGTPEEVARIVAMVQRHSDPEGGPADLQSGRTESRTAPSTKTGPKADILRLKTEGFFRGQRRTIKEVQEALEAQGNIYPVTSLSGPLLSLVKDRELGRLKQDGTWRYVNRG